MGCEKLAEAGTAPSRVRLGSIVLLAPAASAAGARFQTVVAGRTRHQDLLLQAQRLRGSVYLQDGAISSWQLTVDGRHVQEADSVGWHVLALDEQGRVSGCARYIPHPRGIASTQLGAAHSALALSERWGSKVHQALETEIAAARLQDVAFVELGAWAIAEHRRCTTDALRIVLSTYALAQILGGCLGVTTATVRHGSSAILRKLGGRPLQVNGEELPAYYDPQYRCEMELLRFHSHAAEGKMQSWISSLKAELVTAPVFAPADVPDDDVAINVHRVVPRFNPAPSVI